MAEFKLISGAFADGETVPGKHTGDGEDVSPPLGWSDPPAGTESFALICDDPDAPKKTWVHWLLWNVPASADGLDEGEEPTEAKRGKNDFGNLGYGGPAPPPGSPHRYYFRLFALDQRLDLPEGASRDELGRAMVGHILGQTHLMGTYGR